MSLRSIVRHLVIWIALQIPGIQDILRQRFINVHTHRFLQRANKDHDQRENHLNALFDQAFDLYRRAIQEGFSEREATEMVNIIANFDCYNHGWIEMMEFTETDIDQEFETYRGFFSDHGVSVGNPLGDFEPLDGIPDAPATPDQLDNPEYNTDHSRDVSANE
ncbi:MAG: DUF6149 family protein [Halobacteriaceae archaeon]